jgi:hypothetical protein
MAAGLYAIDDLIDNLLNARAHVLNTPRGKRADYETAQPAMIGRIELQHPVAHAAIDRFLKDLWPGPPGYSADKVFTEAFIAQDLGDVGMAACDMETERREVHRVSRPQSMVKGIRIGNKFRCPWIE